MNGYSEEMTFEPGDDEEFALACGYEIIREDDLYELLHLSFERRPSASSTSSSSTPVPVGLALLNRSGNGKRLVSKPSVASFTSTSTHSSGVSSMASNPMSSCSLSSQAFHHGYDEEDDDCFSIIDDLNDVHHEHHEEAEHDYQLSVERIWSTIQKKGHYHDDLDEGIRMDDNHIWTMEDSSNNGRKLPAWFHNLLHFPEKLKQISANRHRFNVNKVPEEIRDELKHIYVY